MSKFFDNDTGMFLLDEMIETNPSFKKIMDDDVVTDEEIKQQSEKVIGLLKSLEEEFSEKELDLATNTITEMSVLYAISQYKQLQDIQDGNI